MYTHTHTLLEFLLYAVEPTHVCEKGLRPHLLFPSSHFLEIPELHLFFSQVNGKL